MTVDDLRATLTQLVGLLQASDAKAATTRALSEFIADTAGFGDVTLKAFVKLAEAGRTPPAPRAVPRPRAAPKAKLDPAALAAEVKAVYDRAADPTVSEEQVRELCGRLGGLTKDALLKVSEGIQLSGMQAKKKDEVVAAITDRLLDRKGAAIRRNLIDRPGESTGMAAPTIEARDDVPVRV